MSNAMDVVSGARELHTAMDVMIASGTASEAVIMRANSAMYRINQARDRIGAALPAADAVCEFLKAIKPGPVDVAALQRLDDALTASLPTVFPTRRIRS